MAVDIDKLIEDLKLGFEAGEVGEEEE